MQEYFEQGIAVVLALVLYTLVDKVVAPLLKRSNGNRSDPKWDHQKYVNGEHERRVAKLEGRCEELRDAVSEIGTAVEVSQAILKRIEKRCVDG